VALLVAAPDLWWQAANGWPQFEMADALAARSDGPLAFLLLQPALLSVVLAVPAALGWWWLARSDEAAAWRPVAVAYPLLAIFFLVTGGKAYYLAPMYTVLVAAGSLWFERLAPTRRRVAVGIGSLGIGLGLMIALPLMPTSAADTFDATGELVETVGWPEFVQQVDDVAASIPDDQAGDAVIFTGSYGEAGALEILGADLDLPPVASGHNNYWLWGPPADHGAIVGVGDVETALSRICPNLEQVGVVDNEHGIENQVRERPLWLCLSPDGQLSDIWDDLRHYD
jgi:hypothetical protein